MSDNQVTHYSASGKFLLFGEYLVLRGAQSLALPLAPGQTLAVSGSRDEFYHWECFQFQASWLKIKMNRHLEIIQTNDLPKAETIRELLMLIQSRNPQLFQTPKNFIFHLDFDRNYGLGTSSTLIALLSQWSGVDPYFLLENSFGGSGYDLAAATASKPFIYTVNDRFVRAVEIPKVIQDQLLFVYLGQKQKSAREVASFKKKTVPAEQLAQMNEIVGEALSSQTIEDWEKAMTDSEHLLSCILGVATVKELYFPDYPFAIKSMGAWGGDFVMAGFRDLKTATNYFQEKGLDPVYTYDKIAK